MINKINTLFIVLLTVACCLVGCNSKVNLDNKGMPREEKQNVNKQEDNNDKHNRNKNEHNDDKIENQNQNTEIENEFIYTNEYQGFKLRIPKEWKDKYSVVTTDKGSTFNYIADNNEEYLLFSIGAGYREEDWDSIPNKEENENLPKEAGRGNGVIYTYDIMKDGGMYFSDEEQISNFNIMSSQVKEIVEKIEFIKPLLRNEELAKLIDRDLNTEREKIRENLEGKWKVNSVVIGGEDLSEDDFNQMYKEKVLEFGSNYLLIQNEKQEIDYLVSVSNLEYLYEYFYDFELEEKLNIDKTKLQDIFCITIQNDQNEVAKLYVVQGKYYIELKGGSLFDMEKL